MHSRDPRSQELLTRLDKFHPWIMKHASQVDKRCTQLSLLKLPVETGSNEMLCCSFKIKVLHFSDVVT